MPCCTLVNSANMLQDKSATWRNGLIQRFYKKKHRACFWQKEIACPGVKRRGASVSIILSTSELAASRNSYKDNWIGSINYKPSCCNTDKYTLSNDLWKSSTTQTPPIQVVDLFNKQVHFINSPMMLSAIGIIS